MSTEGKKIFLIGKDGIQKDKTQNIDSILFNEKNGLYEIRFIHIKKIMSKLLQIAYRVKILFLFLHILKK